MAISYNVYANDGAGGAVNYAAPIATTPAPTYTTAPLAAPSDNTFAVRAFDATSGIEEANTEARVRIVLDGSGNDVTASPNGVTGLSATPTAGGSCWVAWGYNAAGQGGGTVAIQRLPDRRPDGLARDPRGDPGLSAGGRRLWLLGVGPRRHRPHHGRGPGRRPVGLAGRPGGVGRRRRPDLPPVRRGRPVGDRDRLTARPRPSRGDHRPCPAS